MLWHSVADLVLCCSRVLGHGELENVDKLAEIRNSRLRNTQAGVPAQIRLQLRLQVGAKRQQVRVGHSIVIFVEPLVLEESRDVIKQFWHLKIVGKHHSELSEESLRIVITLITQRLSGGA